MYDPFTGAFVSAVASASVTGPELDLADAMATAVLAGCPASVIEGIDGYELLVVGNDGSVSHTDGFPLASPA